MARANAHSFAAMPPESSEGYRFSKRRDYHRNQIAAPAGFELDAVALHAPHWNITFSADTVPGKQNGACNPTRTHGWARSGYVPHTTSRRSLE